MKKVKEFERIMEAVNQGIVASKKSEGEFFSLFSNKLNEVSDYQKTQNGRTAEHSKQIEQLNNTVIQGISKIKGAIWAGGILSSVIIILIGSITAIAVYAYQSDRASLKEGVDTVAKNLDVYQKATTAQTAQLINLLSAKAIK